MDTYYTQNDQYIQWKTDKPLFKIFSACCKSKPCKHRVEFEDKGARLMRGDNIYRMLKKHGLSDPHFDKYAEFVRRKDFPTICEVIADLKQMRDQKREQAARDKERAKQEAEDYAISQLTVAEIRLAKLRKIHCVTKG